MIVLFYKIRNLCYSKIIQENYFFILNFVSARIWDYNRDGGLR